MSDYAFYHVEADEKARLLAAFTWVLARAAPLAFACLYGALVERPDVHDIDIGVYLTPAAAALGTGTWRLEARLGEQLETAVASTIGVRIPVGLCVINQALLPAQFAVLAGEVIYIADRIPSPGWSRRSCHAAWISKSEHWSSGVSAALRPDGPPTRC